MNDLYSPIFHTLALGQPTEHAKWVTVCGGMETEGTEGKGEKETYRRGPRRSGGGGKEEGGREKREGKGENKVKQEKGRGWTGKGRG